MSLLEFLTKTKGIEYLIAIAFLFLFVALWLVIHYRRKNLLLRIVPALVLAVVFSSLAYSCVGTGAQAVTVELNNQAALIASPVLAEMYGPAAFDHNLHQSMVKDCTVCHHHSGSEVQPCKSCHSDSFNPEDPNKPGIAHVYHLRCIGCHTENQAGPTECTGCHTSVPPLSMGHPLAGIENCLNCHGSGVGGAPDLPADHTDATNGVCQLCHSPPVQPAATESQPAATKTQPATTESQPAVTQTQPTASETQPAVTEIQPAASETPAAVTETQPAAQDNRLLIPHSVSGKEDCLMCHGGGIAGAAKVPADHSGRTNDTCQLCHKS